MTPEIYIKRTLNAKYVQRISVIQSLWSGYGEIIRFRVEGSCLAKSVILKSIQLKQVNPHPRGWQSDLAHQRKVDSYEIEKNWYQDWSQSCGQLSRTARCFGILRNSDYIYLLLEDLDESGFVERCETMNFSEVNVVLSWLANFHSRFVQVKGHELSLKGWPHGLWPRGTYWHLETRPNEWEAMKDSPLKQAAKEIDALLNHAYYQTVVHGDAKLANFCFNKDLTDVAAVDFQYVGRGVGVQDVAYFLGSCCSEQDLNDHLEYFLDNYFSELSRCLVAQGESPDMAESVAKEWYGLFPIAWADFHRFIMGWSPAHKKNTAFSRDMTEQVLNTLV